MAMEDFEGVSTIGVYVLLVLDPDLLIGRLWNADILYRIGDSMENS